MPSDTQFISIVSPVYKAEKILPELIRRISQEVLKITEKFEIILVEDGSPDLSWEVIEKLSINDTRIKGVKLSRNFGQQYAISAGLSYAQGDWVIVMDCDLQDNPKYIGDLYEKACEGFEIVYTSKLKRSHNFLKNFFAHTFFYIFNYLSDSQRADHRIGAYSILSRKVVDAFCRIKDTHRHYLMVLRYLGFSTTTIPIVHDKRFEGKSSYSYFKLIKLALNGVVSQSDKLLRISISIGFVFFIVSIVWATYLVYMYLAVSPPAGYTSVMVLTVLATGLILISLGIVGIYIGKIFEQVKERPLYFVDRTINVN